MWARRTSAALAVVYGALIAAIILAAAYYNNTVGAKLFEWRDALVGLSAILLIVSGFAYRKWRHLLIVGWAPALTLALWQVATVQKPSVPASLLHGSREMVAMFRQGNESLWHYVLTVTIVKLVISLFGFCLALYAEKRRAQAVTI
ncbi:MAG: hypothetical protein ACTHPD_15590 [Rhizomicrobium sp.]